MKNSIIKTLSVLLLALLLFFHIQCDRFVEIAEPTDQISQTTVFKDKATALAAMADVYANLRSNSVLDGNTQGVHFLTDIYTDELATMSNLPGGFRSFYDLQVMASNSSVDQLWVSSYRNIYAVNNILEGVARSGDHLDEPTRNILNGESKTIRALLHLYLMQIFGEIPYVESTDYQINQRISKNTVPQLYEKITEDLHAAELLLTEQYPNSGRTRLNKSAVQLLLARTYLSKGDFARARDYAQLVIGKPAYQVESELNKVFLKGAKSTIWQFAPIEAGANTIEAGTFIILDTPPPYGYLSAQLVNSFEPNDGRVVQWIGSVTGDGVTYHFPYKYKKFEITPVSEEYSIVLRIEEAILISAEAENQLGNTNGALQKLKIIRTRAGLTTPTNASAQEVKNLIIAEKRHEFFTEGGHRFFDLKRWGLLETVMASTKPSWQNYMKNWPLPQRELLINPNLNPQNNGY